MLHLHVAQLPSYYKVMHQWVPSGHRRLKKITTVLRLNKTSLRRLEKDVWFTSSWRHPIYDVLKTSGLRRLQDVWFTTFWRRLIYVVLKISNLRRLEDVWFTPSSGRLIYDVLKTSFLHRLEDVQFTTSWRPLIYDVLKTSVKWRLCSNVVATSIQRRKKWFFLLYCLKCSENLKFSSLG